MFADCLPEGLASRDQRRLTGSGSALEAITRNALYNYTFTSLGLLAVVILRQFAVHVMHKELSTVRRLHPQRGRCDCGPATTPPVCRVTSLGLLNDVLRSEQHWLSLLGMGVSANLLTS